MSSRRNRPVRGPREPRSHHGYRGQNHGRRSLTRMRLLAMVLLAHGLLCGTAVLAGTEENDKIGFSPNHVFEGVLQGENVDVMNGNLNLRIPLGPRYMLNHWFGYQVAIYYNSKIWQNKCEGTMCPGVIAPADYGVGFSLHFGRIFHHPDDKADIYRYQTADGGEHKFCWDDTGSQTCNTNTPGVTIRNGKTFDSSSQTVSKAGSDWIVKPGDGRLLRFGHDAGTYDPQTHPSGGTYLTSIETVAATPHSVTVIYEGGNTPLIDRIVDSAGRTIEFIYQNEDPLVLGTRIEFPGLNGQVISYDLEFADETFRDPETHRPAYYLENWDNPPGQPGGQNNYRTVDTKTLTKIQLPETTGAVRPSHEFTYSQPFGYLGEWKLPTGAAVNYYYGHYMSSAWKPIHTELVLKVIDTDPEDTNSVKYPWSYARFGGIIRTAAEHAQQHNPNGTYPPHPSMSNPNKVRVLDPFDNLTVYWFQSSVMNPGDCNACGCQSEWNQGALLRIDTFAGPEIHAQRFIQSQEFGYTYDQRSITTANFCSPTPPGGDPKAFIGMRRSSEKTTKHGSGGSPSREREVIQGDWSNGSSGITGVGDPPLAREVKEYDDGVLVRTTYTNYTPSDNFHRNHDYKVTYGPEGTAVSRTDRVYALNRLLCEVRRADPTATSSAPDCENLSQAGPDVSVAYDYDANGNPVAQTIRGGDNGSLYSSTRTYDNGVLETKKFGTLSWNALDRNADPNTGWIRSAKDPAGVETTYSWDDLGRLTGIAPPTPEVATTIEYPSLQETKLSRVVDEGDQDYVEEVYLYDKLGRLIEERRRTVDDSTAIRRSEHDAAGRVVRQSDWAFDVAAPEEPDFVWTEYKYEITYSTVDGPETFSDPLGRLSHTYLPDGSVRETRYEGSDVRSVVTGIEGLNGTLDADTVQRYDALGRLVGVESPGNGAEAAYEYDALDRLVQVDLTSPETGQVQTRRFVYDPLGRLRQATNPENGTVDYLEYDPRGKLLSHTDAEATTFESSYDAAGRLLSRQVNGTGVLTNTYDVCSPTGTCAGKLTRQVSLDSNGDEVSDVSFSYGGSGGSLCPLISGTTAKNLQATYLGLNGRLSGVTTTLAGWDRELSTGHCYHALGVENLTAFPYEFDQDTDREHSIVSRTLRNGAVWNVIDENRTDGDSNPIEYARTISYDPAGRVTGLKRPRGSTQDVLIETEITRDALGRPEYIRALKGSNTTSSGGSSVPVVDTFGCHDGSGGYVYLEACEGSVPDTPPISPLNLSWEEGPYTYDGAGNISEIGEKQYRYDELSRLVWADVPTSYGIRSQVGYSYDAWGNLTVRNKDSANPLHQVFVVDPTTNRLVNEQQWKQSQMVGSIDFQYDLNGNLIEAGERGYIFDVQNRMQEVWDAEGTLVARYSYDGSNYRVRRQTDTETYYVRDAGGQILSEFSRAMDSDGSPVWNRDYIHAAGQTVSIIKNQNPESPGRVWATNVTTTGLVLQWEEVSELDLSNYQIERLVYPPGATAPADTDHDMATGGAYTATLEPAVDHGTMTVVVYAVRSRDTAGNTSDPGVVRLLPFDPTPPPVPQNLQAVAGEARVTLSWDPVADADEDLWGYQVERTVPGAMIWNTVTATPVTIPGFVDLGLTNNQPYRYRVRSIDTAGNFSAPSAEVLRTPANTTPPDAPWGLIALASPLSTTSVELYWNASVAPDVVRYEIYRGGALVHDVEASYTSFTDIGLNPNTVYEYTVRAVDDGNNASAPTEPAQARTRTDAAGVVQSSSAAFYIETHPDEDTSDPLCSPSSTCTPECAQNDERGVLVEWSKLATPVGVYRVYRAEGDTKVFAVAAEIPENCATGTTCEYFDTQAVGTAYEYFVVATEPGSVPTREGTTDAVHAVSDSFENHAVSMLRASDGKDAFTTANARSRRVTLWWGEVLAPGLQGYNVYRQCQWDHCLDPMWGPEHENLRTMNCVTSWQRLNEEPLQVPFYSDESLGGLGGCWNCAVRAIGPGGQEGDVEVFAAVDTFRTGWDLPNGYIGCETYTRIHYPENKRAPAFGTTIERNRINDIDKGDASAAGAPSPPVVYDYNAESCHVGGPIGYCLPFGDYCPCQAWHTDTCWEISTRCNSNADPSLIKNEPNAAIDDLSGESTIPGAPHDLYGFVTWHPNEEADLRGYYVEMATSPGGPWMRVTPDPIAWWETRYDARLWINDKGDWYDPDPSRFQSATTEWIGPDCAYFRVLAVDEDGEESLPSATTQLIYPIPEDALDGPHVEAEVKPEACNRIGPALASPEIIEVATVDDPPHPAIECTTLLRWKAVSGAAKYRVYRYIETPDSYSFYLTHEVDDSACQLNTDTWDTECEYEQGHDYSFGSDKELHCPWEDDQCYTNQWNAYYITAVEAPLTSGALGHESLPSEIVFWDCTDPDNFPPGGGQSAIDPTLLGTDPWMEEAICELEVEKPDLGILADPGGSLAVASLVTLGAAPVTATNPPIEILDVHVDHLGSTRRLTDEEGHVVASHEFLPFGEEVLASGLWNTKRFTGHERDRETGLDYMFARYYGANLGRFLSVDTISTRRKNALSPQRWNRYPYSGNNPVNFWDPDGRDRRQATYRVITVVDAERARKSNRLQGHLGTAAGAAVGTVVGVKTKSTTMGTIAGTGTSLLMTETSHNSEKGDVEVRSITVTSDSLDDDGFTIQTSTVIYREGEVPSDVQDEVDEAGIADGGTTVIGYESVTELFLSTDDSSEEEESGESKTQHYDPDPYGLTTPGITEQRSPR